MESPSNARCVRNRRLKILILRVYRTSRSSVTHAPGRLRGVRILRPVMFGIAALEVLLDLVIAAIPETHEIAGDLHRAGRPATAVSAAAAAGRPPRRRVAQAEHLLQPHRQRRLLAVRDNRWECASRSARRNAWGLALEDRRSGHRTGASAARRPDPAARNARGARGRRSRAAPTPRASPRAPHRSRSGQGSGRGHRVLAHQRDASLPLAQRPGPGQRRHAELAQPGERRAQHLRRIRVANLAGFEHQRAEAPFAPRTNRLLALVPGDLARAPRCAPRNAARDRRARWAPPGRCAPRGRRRRAPRPR